MIRLGYPVIGVADVAVAAGFWTAALDLVESPEWSRDTWRTLAHRSSGERVLGLMRSESPAEKGADQSTPETGNRRLGSLVSGHGEAVDGSFAVGLGGKAVPAGLVEACVAHEFGDEDEVVSVADEGGAEGVTQGVAGEVVVDACWVGDCADDVVGAAGGQPGAAVVEQQCVGVAGAGPGWAVRR